MPVTLFKYPRTLHSTIYQAPCGPLLLVGDKTTLHYCIWQSDNHVKLPRTVVNNLCHNHAHTTEVPIFVEAMRQLDEYFLGLRTAFCLALSLIGTPFQSSVWQAINRLPYGQVCSYADLAAAVGKATAVRAVAGATAANHLQVLIPCHRVIGSDGTLRGYAGGVERKKYLLNLEGVM